MGLDMYLNRYATHGHTIEECNLMESFVDWTLYMAQRKPEDKPSTFYEWCHGDISLITPQLIEDILPEVIPRYLYTDVKKQHPYNMVAEHVGYWRKANHIHAWFVKNVQNGVDDCDSYIVSREHLIALREACVRIISETIILNPQIGCLQKAIEADWNLEIKVPKKMCQELLPTQSGFFFGDTGYNGSYIYDLCETVKIIENVLTSTDWNKHTVVYHASW